MDLVPGSRHFGSAQVAAAGGGGGADPVDAAAGDREGPRCGGALARIEATGRAPYLYQDFLCHFLGLGAVSRDGQGHAVDGARQPPE